MLSSSHGLARLIGALIIYILHMRKENKLKRHEQGEWKLRGGSRGSADTDLGESPT